MMRLPRRYFPFQTCDVVEYLEPVAILEVVSFTMSHRIGYCHEHLFMQRPSKALAAQGDLLLPIDSSRTVLRPNDDFWSELEL